MIVAQRAAAHQAGGETGDPAEDKDDRIEDIREEAQEDIGLRRVQHIVDQHTFGGLNDAGLFTLLKDGLELIGMEMINRRGSSSKA